MTGFNRHGPFRRRRGLHAWLGFAVGMGCLVPGAAAASQCLYAGVPGEVILYIDNDTTEEQAMTLVSRLDLEVNALRSESLLVSLYPDAALKTGDLERAAHVRRVRETQQEITVLFDESVTNAYVLQLLQATPGARIKYITPRRPRKARVIVPAGQEETWSERLAAYSGIRDAFPDCATAYRAACEKYGGTIQRSGFDTEKCEPPQPLVKWDRVLAEGREECSRSGGSWSVYQDSCVDSCTFEKKRYCSAVVTESCHCGPGRCWYEKPVAGATAGAIATCIEIPDWYKRGDRDF